MNKRVLFSVLFIYVRREKRKCASRVACICGRSARKEGRQSILIPIIASLSDCNWVGLEPPTASIHVSFVMPEDWNNEGTEVSPLCSYVSTASIFWLYRTCLFRTDELSRNELLKIIYCLCIDWIFSPSNSLNFTYSSHYITKKLCLQLDWNYMKYARTWYGTSCINILNLCEYYCNNSVSVSFKKSTQKVYFLWLL